MDSCSLPQLRRGRGNQQNGRGERLDAFPQLETLVLPQVFNAVYWMNEIRRAAEILLVLEKIYGQPPYPIKTKADEERQAEEAQEENAEANTSPKP